jgi:hypothetical protein
MELYSVVYDVAKWYGFFALVTSLTFVCINLDIMLKVRPPFTFMGYVAYLATIAFYAFIFAPGFFVMLVKYSDLYTATVINVLLEDEEK